MNEKVMNVRAVQSFLLDAFHTEQVRVREVGRVITIEPAEEQEYHCPLWGIAKGGTLTVEKLLKMSQVEKELEDANEMRLYS